MNTNYKKTLKLATLILTSLLIAYASAETYSELYMRAAPITITAAGTYFTNGANTTDIGAILYGGTEVNFTGMSVRKGETQIYSEAVNVTNNAGAAKNITLTVTATGGNLTAFDYVNVSIIDETGALKGSSIYLSTASNTTTTGKIVMDNSKVWAVRWEVKALTSADAGTTLEVYTKLTVEE